MDITFFEVPKTGTLKQQVTFYYSCEVWEKEGNYGWEIWHKSAETASSVLRTEVCSTVVRLLQTSPNPTELIRYFLNQESSW